MERAGKALRKLKLSGKIPADELARAAWPAAVGKRIALHTGAIALVRGRLVIEVEDALWKKQLFDLQAQIIGRLQEVIGSGLIDSLEFRIAERRLPPRLATQAALPEDEADLIADNALRIVYKKARKKASA